MITILFWRFKVFPKVYVILCVGKMNLGLHWDTVINVEYTYLKSSGFIAWLGYWICIILVQFKVILKCMYKVRWLLIYLFVAIKAKIAGSQYKCALILVVIFYTKIFSVMFITIILSVMSTWRLKSIYV